MKCRDDGKDEGGLSKSPTTKSTNKNTVGGMESWTTAKDTSVPNAEMYETEVGWV